MAQEVTHTIPQSYTHMLPHAWHSLPHALSWSSGPEASPFLLERTPQSWVPEPSPLLPAPSPAWGPRLWHYKSPGRGPLPPTPILGKGGVKAYNMVAG